MKHSQDYLPVGPTLDPLLGPANGRGVVAHDLWPPDQLPKFSQHEPIELSVSQARDQFSDAVNRAAFGVEITSVTRGRGCSRAAAIAPADLVEAYESLIDQADDVARDLGL